MIIHFGLDFFYKMLNTLKSSITEELRESKIHSYYKIISLKQIIKSEDEIAICQMKNLI